MYCIKCGVELADTEKKCPLCGTGVFHPDVKQPEGELLYPREQYSPQQVSPWGMRLILIAVFLLPLLTVLICDLQLSGGVTWSGYVIGALVVCYVTAVLPGWFEKPNPVILVPCDFAVLALYLLYIDMVTPGSWFMTFAFPVTGFAALVTTAVVTLMRYVRKGRLYIFGGAGIAVGLFMPVMEQFLYLSWRVPFIGWSWYPLAAFVLLGGFLIFLAICRPAREMMERKFFL